MTNDERIFALQQAVELIQGVHDSLDGGFVTCSGCNRQHFTNWNEQLFRNLLNTSISKLGAVKAKLVFAVGKACVEKLNATVQAGANPETQQSPVS